MAYYTGSVSSIPALRAAMIDACANGGWAWDSANEVLSKGAAFFRLQVVTGAAAISLALTGRTSATAGDAPGPVCIATAAAYASAMWAWPVMYHIMTFADEVYVAVNYNQDYWQHLAFGISNLADALPGTGAWCTGSVGNSSGYITSLGVTVGSGSSTSSSSSNASGNNGVGLYFLETDVSSNPANSANYLHNALGNQTNGAWNLNGAVSDGLGYASAIGIKGICEMLYYQPNAWNDEAVLVPIRAWRQMPSFMVALVAELQNARYTKMDHYNAREIITLGPDRWIIFPLFRKDLANRNGGTASTGTLAVAIRYDGP